MVCYAWLENTQRRNVLTLTLFVSATTDFRKLLNFSAADGANVPTSFTALEDLGKQVRAVNMSTFGWDEATQKTNYNTYNTQCVGGAQAACWARDNITAANATLRATIQSLNYNYTLVEWKVGNMTDTLTDFKSKMATIQADAEPLMAAADNLKNAGDCSFLKTNYVAFADLLCQDVVGNILTLSLCMWVVGFLGIPMIICNVYMNVNIGGVGYIGNGEDDDLNEGGKPKTMEVQDQL